MKTSIENTLKALKKHDIDAQYFESSEAAVEMLMTEIGLSETIGVGGSVTVKNLGIPDKLLNRGNKLFYHWLEVTPEKVLEARRNAMNADVYISSTNALTEKGQLVNIDGIGNRVAAMFYGPKKVFIICGINKITKDLDGAFEYIKANTYKNARRLGLKTPCAITEKCNDCDSPERMCRVTTIIERKPRETSIKVIIIGEELGY